MCAAQRRPIAQYDSFAGIETIARRPLLMVAGSAAAAAHPSRTVIERAGEPKELVRIDGASHFDLYDKDAYASVALAKFTSFFGEHLNKPPTEGRSPWWRHHRGSSRRRRLHTPGRRALTRCRT